jgi:putative chitinase
MRVNEIFCSIQGEGKYAGCPAIFIRLSGCTRKCSFCDTKYHTNGKEMSVEDVPDYLATFEGAVQSACWFWEANNLNKYADSGDILNMTKKINGGTIGLEDRINHYNHALHVLGA